MVTRNLDHQHSASRQRGLHQGSEDCIKAARTASAVLSQISRAFHFQERRIFVRLYTQYTRTHIEFAVSAWYISPWTTADKQCLEKVQKRAIRMVNGLAGQSFEERLVGLNMEVRRRGDIGWTCYRCSK